MRPNVDKSLQKMEEYLGKKAQIALSLHPLQKYEAFVKDKGVISSVGLERRLDRAEVTGSNPVLLTTATF